MYRAHPNRRARSFSPHAVYPCRPYRASFREPCRPFLCHCERGEAISAKPALDKGDDPIERPEAGEILVSGIRSKPALLGLRRRREQRSAETVGHDPVTPAMQDQNGRLYLTDARQG